MLRIHHNSNSQLVKAGWQVSIPPGLAAAVGFWGLLTELFDELYIAFRNGDPFFVPDGVVPVSKVFGFSGYDQFASDIIVSKPVRRIDDIDDYANYANFLANISLFSHTLAGLNTYSPANQGAERSCRHVTYSGDLLAETTDLPMYRETYPIWDFIPSVRNSHDLVVSGFHVNGISPLTGNYLTEVTSNATHNLIDLLDQLVNSNGIHSVRVLGGLSHFLWLHGCSYEDSESSLSVRYSIQLRVFVGTRWEEYNWTTSYFWEKSFPEPGVTPVVDSSYHVEYTTPFRIRMEGISTTDGTDTTGFDYTSPLLRAGPIILGYQQSDPVLDRSILEDVYQSLSNNRFLYSFEGAVNKHWRGITSSAAFSAVDAFRQAEGQLADSQLQSLQKLPDIASAIPNLREAVDLLGKLMHRDLSLLTLRELLNLVTSTVLQANFQWGPYYRIITEILPNIRATLDNLSNEHDMVIGRGSYHTTLSNVLGRKTVSFTVRSKVVMDGHSFSMLASVLNLDSFGLLPKPSNLWDTLPFSFVANWFTGVGDAIRRAEYGLLLATIPAYFVHSYTLSSPLTEDELDLLGMSNGRDHQASLRIYYRDVSHYSPFPRDSEFDFGIPRGFPPLGTLGSLLYQLLFGS